MPARKASDSTPNRLLRRARQLHGWTQEELGHQFAVMIGPQQISRWERGHTKPKLAAQQELCRILGKDAISLGFVERPGYGGSTNLSAQEVVARSAKPSQSAKQQRS